MKVAVVVTVKNEEADILKLLRALEAQSRVPDILVLTIADSQDKTAQIVTDWAVLSSLKTEIDYVDGNRSKGRNLGIRHAIRHGAEIVVLTNVCQPFTDWLETLVKPIEVDGKAVVGGSWILDSRSDREDAMGLLTQYDVDQLGANKISALNMAVHASVLSIGDFREDLDTSEDTEFVQRLRDKGIELVYEPDAMVLWRPSTLNLRDAAKTYYQFAKTDRKAGLKTGQYLATGGVYLAIGVLVLVNPLFGALSLGGWLLFRARKVFFTQQLPAMMLAAFVLDWARIIGFSAE